MPYALIPDGYSLKKVTKLQKQAVNEKRRHDDVIALLTEATNQDIILIPCKHKSYRKWKNFIFHCDPLFNIKYFFPNK